MSTSDDETAALNAAGLNSKVLWAPIKAPQLVDTDKSSVYSFLGRFDRYQDLVKDRMVAGEDITPVRLIRCVQPELLDFLQAYVLTKVADDKADDQMRTYLDDIIKVPASQLTAKDIVKRVRWNSSIEDPQARVIAVFRAIRDILLKEGLDDNSFPEKELVDEMAKIIEPEPLRTCIQGILQLPLNKDLRKDRKKFFQTVLAKTVAFEEFHVRSMHVGKFPSKKVIKPILKKASVVGGLLGGSHRSSYGQSASVKAGIANGTIKCHNCGGPHLRPNCPSRTSPRRTSGRVDMHHAGRGDAAPGTPAKKPTWQRSQDKRRLQKVSPGKKSLLGRIGSAASGVVPVILQKLYHADIVLDSGATSSIIPIDLLQDLLNVVDVEIEDLAHPRMFTLADGSEVESLQLAYIDCSLQMNHGPVNIRRVRFFVLPGESREILMGVPEQRRLGLPGFEELLEEMAQKDQHAQDDLGDTSGVQRINRLLRMKLVVHDELETVPDARPTVVLNDLKTFKQKRMMSTLDAADIESIDSVEGVVADPLHDQRSAIREEVDKMLEQAKINGADKETMEGLTAVVMENYDVWRVELGADPPADVPPLRIQLLDESKLPRTHCARRFSPLQQTFLHDHVEMLIRAGVTTASNSDCANGVVLVRKSDGTWRMCVDLRRINAITRRDVGPLPRIGDLLAHLEGSRFFASLDLLKGYWQFPVDLQSQRFLAFITHRGIFQFTRVVMGARNSAAHFQRIMTEILDTMLFVGVLLYLDDILVYATNPVDLVNRLKEVLVRLRARGIFVQPRKCVIFAKCITWVGHHVNADGIAIDPSWLDTTLSIPAPVNAGELQQFLAAVNWVRGKIPCYAELVEPLQSLLQRSLKGLRKRNKSAAARVILHDKGWVEEHERTFNDIKAALTETVRLAHPKDDYVVCMFTDASSLHWASVLTQVPTVEFANPALSCQEWHHEPLSFLSGSFRDSARNWAIVDKEAFAIYESCKRMVHLLVRNGGFHIFTDHRNLLYIFNPAGVVASLSKPTADRLERWSVFLRAFEYTIQHIEGETNVWADMLSRWGNGTAEAHEVHESLRAVRMRLRGGRVLPTENVDILVTEQWPTMEVIARAQPDQDCIGRFGLTKRDDGGWSTRRGQVYVCNESVRVRLLVIAHAGAAGHRSISSTTEELEKRFFWANMRKDIKTFMQRCLLCVKTKGGGLVPRPQLHQLAATTPGKMIHFDYCKMTQGEGGMAYVLVIKDNFSTFTWLWQCASATAAETVLALLTWFGTFGVADTWISDQGTHFMNEVMKGVCKALRTEHHFVTVYSPWANGAVERVNRELVRLMRTLLAEAGLQPTQWPSALMLSQAIVNNTSSLVRLAGLTPHEVMFGRKCTRPLDAILGIDGEHLTGPKGMAEDVVKEHADRMSAILQEHWGAVTEGRDRMRVYNDKRAGKLARPVDFDIGDFVLVYSAKKRNKLRVMWTGPFRVVDTINAAVYVCEHLVTGARSSVHAQRIRMYADSTLEVTTDLRDQAAHDMLEYFPDSIVGWREGDEGTLELKIHWLGLESSEDSWEPLNTFYEDAPTMVKRYAQQQRKRAPQLLQAVKEL